MAKLHIHRDGAPPVCTQIEPTTTVGRLKECTVQLEDPQISRVHAVITMEDGAFLLNDQGSMNGTYVNRTKLERAEKIQLNDGDVIGIQMFTLRFECDMGSLSAKQLEAASSEALSSKESVLADLEKPPEPCVLLSHLLDDGRGSAVWSKGEMTLRVADIIEETWDTKTFRLVGHSATLFSYKPGQFVTLTVNIDGEPVQRSYSVSSSPSRPHTLELTIKRVPGGLVSNWMNDRVSLGDELKVRGPAGKFSCFNYPSRKMLCIAGGSGITPIMSMLRWIVDTAADVDVVLLYSGRSPADFIFRKELETISARHNGLRVIFTVTSSWTGTESWTGLTGRCNKRMIELVAPEVHDRHVFLCGPKPFSDAVKAELDHLDYPMANLHTESFGQGRVATPRPAPAAPVASPAPAVPAAPAPPKAEPAPAPSPAHQKASGYRVTFEGSGVEAQSDPEGTILELAEAHGVEIDYACRQGSCGSCRTKCLSGKVSMDDADLSNEEREEGWILACVAVAESDVVIGS
jgi:ferredoxin-NADP reductase